MAKEVVTCQIIHDGQMFSHTVEANTPDGNYSDKALREAIGEAVMEAALKADTLPSLLDAKLVILSFD